MMTFVRDRVITFVNCPGAIARLTGSYCARKYR